MGRLARLKARRALRGVDYAELPYVAGPPPMILVNQGTIRLGRGVSFRADPGEPARMSTGPDGLLEIGDGVFINALASLHASTHVTIGAHALIANFVSITDDAYHAVDAQAPRQAAPITIGERVWLGPRAMILPGVTIGAHSVVGANSVVTRDIPAHTLVGGVPAVTIRELDIPEGWTR